jgi:hypothetical protein
MSSGLGLKGNVSRCFEYFQDFSVCMVSAVVGRSWTILISDEMASLCALLGCGWCVWLMDS